MARPKSDVLRRFISKIKVSENGCHEWTAGLHRDGYGKFQNDGKTISSHRMAYELFIGEIPDKLCILHSCDNRKCVNPAHLSLGTLKDNINDMDNKKRRGSNSSLTYSDVAKIKEMIADRYTQSYIASKFGVCQTTISKIKLNKTVIFKKE
jgi:HNH endonuclease